MQIPQFGVRAAVLAIGLLAQSSNASAMAIATVERNTVRLLLGDTYGIVDGNIISQPAVSVSVASYGGTPTKTETGDAAVNFSSGLYGPETGSVGAFIGGSAIAKDGYAFGTYTFDVTFAITNLSGIDLDHFVIWADYSSFNPGGSQIGARVDDTATEFARFSSFQASEPVADSHQCDTRGDMPNYSALIPPSGVECGVMSPDSSLSEIGFDDFDQNETLYRSFTLTLILEAKSVPEPGTLVLFAGALLGIAGYRLRLSAAA